MSFLKELFNSIARTLGRIIAYALIGFLIFFVFGKLTNAQSLTFTRPRIIEISNYWQPNQGTYIHRCTDTITCGSLTGTTGGGYIHTLYRIDQNNEDSEITTLPKGTYKLQFGLTARTLTKLNSSSVALSDFNLRIFVSGGSQYSTAYCDVTAQFTAENFSDNSNRLELTYTCPEIKNDRDDITFFGVTLYANELFTYAFISSNLKIIDTSDPNQSVIDNQNQNTQDIINNQNQNTQDIINNQNQNQNQTNNKLDDINDSLTDSSVPNVDNVPQFEFNNGPISGLLTMPITWFNAFVNPGVCKDISLGQLLGTELKFECINPEEFLGSSIWGTIDIFIVVMMIISIASMILHIVESFRNLNDMYDEYYTPKHAGYKTKHNGERI